MKSIGYKCASVFTGKDVLVYYNETSVKAVVAKHIQDRILVGDNLVCEMKNGQLVVQDIRFRKNVLCRRQGGQSQALVSNIDMAFIVTSANQDFNIARLERYYIIAKECGAKVGFILSKVDLSVDYSDMLAIINNRFPNCFITESSFEHPPINLFQQWKAGETAVFLGSSGVGKSTLINHLLNENIARTNSTSLYNNKGKHTTTARHLYALPNSRFIIDTPGLRSIGVSTTAETIDVLFPEIVHLSRLCKYKDCTHRSEPGCAVLDALKSEKLDINCYYRYLKLKGQEELMRTLKEGKTYQKEDILHEFKAAARTMRKKRNAKYYK